MVLKGLDVPDGVGASGAVLADRRTDFAFVDIFVAEIPRKVGRALAVVGVDPVDACSSVLAEMTVAIVDVDFAAEPQNIRKRADEEKIHAN